jgi:two-component system response regulator MtrA
MRARVLVVDDDPALAEMLGIVLRSEGFLPSFVADGERALAAFRDARPGHRPARPDAARHERHRRVPAIRAESGLPIVMLTAKSDTVDVVLGLESGADDYVSSRSSRRNWSPGCGPGCAAARTSRPSC